VEGENYMGVFSFKIHYNAKIEDAVLYQISKAISEVVSQNWIACGGREYECPGYQLKLWNSDTVPLGTDAVAMWRTNSQSLMLRPAPISPTCAFKIAINLYRRDSGFCIAAQVDPLILEENLGHRDLANHLRSVGFPEYPESDLGPEFLSHPDAMQFKRLIDGGDIFDAIRLGPQNAACFTRFLECLTIGFPVENIWISSLLISRIEKKREDWGRLLNFLVEYRRILDYFEDCNDVIMFKGPFAPEKLPSYEWMPK
jgi:hypothetical protein